MTSPAPLPFEDSSSEDSPEDDAKTPPPFLRPDDLLSSSWTLRRAARQRPVEEDFDSDDELLEVSLDELEDEAIAPLFQTDLHSKARDQLKAWCETVDDDVWVLDLDAED